MNRRDVLTGLGAAVLLAQGNAMAENGKSTAAQAAASAFAGKHALKPLPFDAAKLRGLSEKLIRSHHENNYGGALKSLNKVEVELASVNKDTPAHLVGGLKERELTYRNSVVLHEWYFGNLGGDGKPAGSVVQAVTESYGSFAKFEEHFRALGASLGGGSGWAILEYDLALGAPRAYGSGHHAQSFALGIPLLVMDMYEHSYAMDYGAAAARYIDAFFQNIPWEAVEKRYTQAVKIAGVLRT
jgi:superoxide dismutase, Fe-Mn family